VEIFLSSPFVVCMWMMHDGGWGLAVTKTEHHCDQLREGACKKMHVLEWRE